MDYVTPFPSWICIFKNTCKCIQGLLYCLIDEKANSCISRRKKEMVLAKKKSWFPEFQKETECLTKILALLKSP